VEETTLLVDDRWKVLKKAGSLFWYLNEKYVNSPRIRRSRKSIR
jgi:hypothetical protein